MLCVVCVVDLYVGVLYVVCCALYVVCCLACGVLRVVYCVLCVVCCMWCGVFCVLLFSDAAPLCRRVTNGGYVCMYICMYVCMCVAS